MPSTSIPNAVVSQPITPPTALVTSPTDPASFSTSPCIDLILKFAPCASSQARILSAWACTTAGSCAACWAICVPAKAKVQAMNTTAKITTIATRQPRPIGRTRPSSRTPPSIIAANTIPPKMISKGWAR